MTNKKSLKMITTLISSNFSCWLLYCLSCEFPFWLLVWYLQTFLVGHCISCHASYRSDYPFDIFKLFVLVIVLPVMWVTVLITPLISSNFSCWLLYCLSCELPFWLPLWYLQTFLVGHCIACHVSYRSDYSCDIFKLFMFVIVYKNGNSSDRQYNDQQEKFEDIKGVIRTVNHMTGNTMTNKKSLKISKG
jgi:hypothetical protein